MMLSIIYLLFHGSQIYWQKKTEYLENTTDLLLVTDKYHKVIFSSPCQSLEFNLTTLALIAFVDLTTTTIEL